MSIEKSFESIAHSLEKLSNYFTPTSRNNVEKEVVPSNVAPVSDPFPRVPGPTETPVTPPVPPAPPKTETPVDPVPPNYTIEELNDELMKEYDRLGDKKPIDDVLKKHGVESLTKLDVSKYNIVLDEVRAYKKK